MKYLYIFFLVWFPVTALAQNEARFYATIDSLCSTSYQGRGPTFDGDVRVAHFLEKEFRTADTVYLQGFNYPIVVFPQKNSLTLHRHRLKIGTDYIAHAASPSIKGKFSFFHFPSSSKRIYEHEVKQKSYFVFLADSMKSKLDSLLPFMYSCQGVFYESDNLLSSMSRKLEGKPSFEILNTKFLRKDSHLKLDYYAELDSNHLSYNVIAEIKGQREDSVIVICAHYDHLGHLDKNTVVVGANDNASGVSMMLEMFHYYKEYKPNYTLRFIAFAAEECGLLGSKFYVSQLKNSNIKFVLNLDLIGAGSQGITVVNAVNNKPIFDKFLQLNEANKYVAKIKPRPNSANSDHYPFSQKNIPAVFVYSNGDVGGYHDVEDISSRLERGYFLALFSLFNGLIDSYD